MLSIKGKIRRWLDDWHEQRDYCTSIRRKEEADERFNIRRIGNKDYIVYNGVIVSREEDNDILDRLSEYRINYSEFF